MEKKHPIDKYKRRLIEDGFPDWNDPPLLDFIKAHREFRHLEKWIKLIGSRVMGELLTWKETGIDLLKRLLELLSSLCKKELVFHEEACEKLAKAIVYNWLIICIVTFTK